MGSLELRFFTPWAFWGLRLGENRKNCLKSKSSLLSHHYLLHRLEIRDCCEDIPIEEAVAKVVQYRFKNIFFWIFYSFRLILLHGVSFHGGWSLRPPFHFVYLPERIRFFYFISNPSPQLLIIPRLPNLVTITYSYREKQRS